MKRIFDLFFSFTGLLVLSPFLGLLSVFIKLADGGSVFFRQRRIGFMGREFQIWKFRSMVENAPSLGDAITVGADSRITPLGRVLRRYKLDEFPQLLNVLSGEMSLVGPRPEVAEYVELYTASQREVLKLKPGITDPASFAFHDEAEILAKAEDPRKFYRDRLMPEKIRINLEYAAKATLYSDFVLILATLAQALGAKVDIFAWLKIREPSLGYEK